MAAASPNTPQRRFQGPKGTRDFFPEAMSWRRYIENAWRTVSIRHGFDEIEGPMFEMLDLYKVKSGDGIVSELFAFEDRGGRQLALRPEFTPTLARMVVAQAASLPRPIKWFAIPAHFRAERPQRGRLREFMQWNVDFIGDDSVSGDTEVLGVAIDLLAELGITREIARVHVSHRETVSKCLLRLGLSENQLAPAFALLDKRDKLEPQAFEKMASEIGLSSAVVAEFTALAKVTISADREWEAIAHAFCVSGCVEDEEHQAALVDLKALHASLNDTGLASWCDFDLGIVRGLAYYTGMVFEIHESSGSERAIAGGGRYDKLIETFGGPSLPACGFGMGDVVLGLVLEDNHLRPEPEDLRDNCELFIVNTAGDAATAAVSRLMNESRRSGIHCRRSYKTTRNLGKLLKDAGQCGAQYVAILGQEFIDDNLVALKELQSGHQVEIEPETLSQAMLQRLGRM